MTEPVCSYLQLELELFPFDTMLDAAVCTVEQVLKIELSDVLDNQCQMSLISCQNKGIAFL